MAGPLAQKIRAKFPGVYDDMDDAALERAVLAKYPEYADLSQPDKPQSSAAPSLADQLIADNPALPLTARAGAWMLRMAKANPVQTGAMIGGTLASLPTAGASFPLAMAATGAGGALGAGAGQLASGQRPDLGTMAKEGALSAAGEGVGRGVVAGGKLLARGLYRAGALPINQLMKYGDLIDVGLQEGVPVSKAGLAKAGALAAERQAEKAAAIQAADQRVVHSAKAVANTAAGPLTRTSRELVEAGLDDPLPALQAKLDLFEKANPPGTLTPSIAERIKGTIDDRAGGAFKKIRGRDVLTPDEQYLVQMTKTLGDAQSAAVPGYREMNKGIMDAQGLKKMIGRRVNPTSSGGNQGLENALTMAAGLKALPARVLMMPPVTSSLGIGVNAATNAVAPIAAPFVRALLLALGSAPDE